MLRYLASASLLLGLLTPAAVLAQLTGPGVPDSLSIQGILTDTNGVVVPDGNYDLQFKLYKVGGGSSVWDHLQVGIPVENGLFNVILGGAGSASLESVAFNEPMELGITPKPGITELTPRTPLTAVPYALAVRGFYAVDAEFFGDKSPNVVAGARNNSVAANVVGGTIGGGGGSYLDQPGSFPELGSGRVDFDLARKASLSAADIPSPNSVIGNWGTVGGGHGNTADFNGSVGGGVTNTASGNASTVAGGAANQAIGSVSAIAGGSSNTATEYGATVAGGVDNDATGTWSTVAGGVDNEAAGDFSFAAGYRAKALHEGSFVWNSESNPFESTGAGQFLIHATGGVGLNTSTTPQDLNIDDGDEDGDVIARFHKSASGTDMVVGIHGSDYGLISVQSLDHLVFRTGASERVRLTDAGFLGVGTSSPAAKLHVHHANSTTIPQLRLSSTGSTGFARLRMHNANSTPYWDIAAGAALNDELNFFQSSRGNVISLHSVGDPLVAFNGAYLDEGGMWHNSSSVDKKTDFDSIDVDEVLRKVAMMPIGKWRYKVETESVSHLGPTSQDFFYAFGLGEDSETIGTVDADGVALAAIQGLYQLVKEQQAEIERMRAAMREAGIE